MLKRDFMYNCKFDKGSFFSDTTVAYSILMLEFHAHMYKNCVLLFCISISRQKLVVISVFVWLSLIWVSPMLFLSLDTPVSNFSL